MTPQEQTRLMGMIAAAFEVSSIENLAAIIKERTGLTFANPRQPTVEEAQRALGVLEKDAGAMAAIMDRGNPTGQTFQAMRTLLYGRIHSPPMDNVGQAVALDAPPAKATAGQREEFAWMTPEEARDRLRWAEWRGEYGDAVQNELHAEHADALADIAELKAIRDKTPVPNRDQPAQQPQQQQQPPPAGPAGEAMTPAQRQAARAKLHADERYLNRQHPEHAAAMEEMVALYRVDHPDPTPVADLPGEPAAPRPNVITGPGPIAPAGME